MLVFRDLEFVPHALNLDLKVFSLADLVAGVSIEVVHIVRRRAVGYTEAAKQILNGYASQARLDRLLIARLAF